MKIFRNIIERIKERREKYGVKAEENIPREVYGVARPPKNERDQYNIKPERKKEVIRCPKCGNTLRKYIYGFVRGEIDREKFIIGGCMVHPDNPSYYCENCNINFDNNMNVIPSAFEKTIIETVGNDPFWKELIIKYFKEDINYDEETALKLLTDVSKNKEIFGEFTKYLVKRSYDIDNAINIDGVTAKEIANNNPDKSAIEIYIMLSDLNNKNEN